MGVGVINYPVIRIPKENRRIRRSGRIPAADAGSRLVVNETQFDAPIDHQSKEEMIEERMDGAFLTEKTKRRSGE